MDKYQTLGARILALILDGVFLIFASVAIVVLSINIGGWMAENLTTLTAVFSLCYHVLLHYYFGQTLGKKIANVKVVDISEKPVTFGQSVIRSLPQLIVVMFSISFSTADKLYGEPDEMFWKLQWGVWIFTLIDIGFFLAQEKRRALHDFIAGTIVVRTDV